MPIGVGLAHLGLDSLDAFGYLDDRSLRCIACELDISQSLIYGTERISVWCADVFTAIEDANTFRKAEDGLC